LGRGRHDPHDAQSIDALVVAIDVVDLEVEDDLVGGGARRRCGERVRLGELPARERDRRGAGGTRVMTLSCDADWWE
jgi:hypothetical protein